MIIILNFLPLYTCTHRKHKGDGKPVMVGGNRSSPVLAPDLENYAPVLAHTLDNEVASQTHLYEDPDYINGQTTLSAQQQHLVDPSDYDYINAFDSNRDEHAEFWHPQRMVTAMVQSSPSVSSDQQGEGYAVYYI